MRVLILSDGEGLSDELARAAVAAGHQPSQLGLSGSGKRASAKFLAQLSRSLITSAPDLAFLSADRTLLPAALALSARGVPFVIGYEPRHLAQLEPNGALPIGVELSRQAFRGASRVARATVLSEPGLLDSIDAALGLPSLTVLPEVLDLSRLPLAEKSEARQALSLPRDAFFFGLCATLDDRVALERIALAQRKVPGAGLLVAGSGPAEDVVLAMSAATRPSSPVIHLGPNSEAVGLSLMLACDVGLCPSALPRRDVLAYLALGRRVVSESPEGWAQGLADARAIERREGPLSRAVVEQARAKLDRNKRGEKLLELLCASCS